jgi:hypothetical protein
LPVRLGVEALVRGQIHSGPSSGGVSLYSGGRSPGTPSSTDLSNKACVISFELLLTPLLPLLAGLGGEGVWSELASTTRFGGGKGGVSLWCSGAAPGDPSSATSLLIHGGSCLEFVGGHALR